MAHVVLRIARNAGIVALFMIAAMLGILSGVMFAYAGDLPQVSALDDYTPNTITRVYASGGQVVGEFATERRVVVSYDDINPLLRQAIIATEDSEFESHFGINIWRMLVAAGIDLMEWRRAQGASTLTQQLARNLTEHFGLTTEKSYERKVREIILAIQIEKRYTKREIFTIYCNQMYLGHGAYGVEAASRLYFGKTNKQLTLEEAALIAGIFQSNVRQSPFVDMKRATQRRNVVLQRMADEKYINQKRADEAKATPIVTRGQPSQPPGIAPYFVEEVRKHLERQYGAKVLYEKGLAVTTTLDARLQEIGNKTIEHGLRAYDKRRGWRKPTRNVITDQQTIEQYQGRALESRLRGWRCRSRGRGHGAEDRAGATADWQITRRSRARRLYLDAPRVRCRPVQAGRPDRGGDHEARGRRHVDGDVGADAAGRSGVAGDR